MNILLTGSKRAWSTFLDSSMGTKLKYFWRTHETVKYTIIFSQKHVSRKITFHVIHISWFWHGYKVKIILQNSWNCQVRQNIIIKTCLTNKYFSRDPYFVILAGVQSWNSFEKLMKMGIPPDILSQKHVSQTTTFHLIQILWF